MRLHDAAPPVPRFLVYWKHAGQQLFAFTTSVRAQSAGAGLRRCTGADGWPDAPLCTVQICWDHSPSKQVR